MYGNFSEHIQIAETTMRIEAQEIPQTNYFHYHGSIISKDGEIEEDVEHRIKAGWLKWRLALRLLCDQRMQ